MLTLVDMEDVKKKLNDPKNHVFTPEMMAIVLADKKQRREKKGIKFNCVVLDSGAEHDQVGGFLDCLQRYKSKINGRFQAVYHCSRGEWGSEHWTTMDVSIKNGELEFYLLDAAHALKNIFVVILTILDKCPDAKINYSSGSMQREEWNCATFSLDHAYRVSKIANLYEKLNKIKTDHRSSDEVTLSMIQNVIEIRAKRPKIVTLQEEKKLISFFCNDNFNYINVTNMPTDFGPLLRNMQSLSTLSHQFFTKNMMGNDHQDLQTYVKARVVKNQNGSIEIKREKIKLKAAAFLDGLSLDDFNAVVDEQKNYLHMLQKAYRKELASSFRIRHWCIGLEDEATGSDISVSKAPASPF